MDNLVDCTKELHFEMELSAPIDKRTLLTSIRREARALRMNSSESYEHGTWVKTGWFEYWLLFVDLVKNAFF